MVQMKTPAVAAPIASDQKCIWIASYPKSGNTWLRVFLHNLFRLIDNPSTSPQDINRLHEYTDWELRPGDYDKLLGKPSLDATPAEIAEARFRVQTRLAASKPGAFLVKTHNAVASVGGYPTVNVDVTLAAIYLVRNPLDVAISYAHHSGISIDRTIASMEDEKLITSKSRLNVYEFLGSWSFHVASWLSLPHRPVYLMRYEDMLADPVSAFTALAKYLRLKANAAQIEAAINMSHFGELAAQEDKNGFNERPKQAPKFFRSGKAGQWREVLTQAQIRAVVSAHAPMMQRCGYLPPDVGGDLVLVGNHPK